MWKLTLIYSEFVLSSIKHWLKSAKQIFWVTVSWPFTLTIEKEWNFNIGLHFDFEKWVRKIMLNVKGTQKYITLFGELNQT